MKKKELISRSLGVKVHPSLFEKFSGSCKKNYKTVSEVIRDFMAKYVQDNQNKE